MTTTADERPGTGPVAGKPERRWRLLAPGIAVAVAVALVARGLHSILPPVVAEPVGEVIIAIALGFVVANTFGARPSWRRGTRFCVSAVLRAAIVLLGARLAFGQVLAIGGGALLLIVTLMTVALLVAHGLARLTHTPRPVASLVGVGVSVCGNTAIIATAPAIGASDDDVATAIAVNTLFGMLAVIVYPLVGHVLGMEAAAFGTWAGTAVNDTSQVVAVGFAHGAVAGQIATTVKLARNALMGVVIVVMSGLHGAGKQSSPVQLLRKSFPLFVIGFLAMAVVNSVGGFDAASRATGIDVVAVLTAAAQLMLLVALAAVGLATSTAGLRRTGWRPFVVGFGAAAATSALSFTAIRFFGAVGG